MDWKEQLSTLLEELAQSLDVRLICIKDKEKWFLKRLRAIVFHPELSIPEQICYPTYLFLRREMSTSEFLQLMSALTTRSTLPQEELEKLSAEEKLKKFSFNGREIFCEVVNIVFRNHSRGNSRWVLADYALPTWNFDGNLYPDLQESQEPLFAHEAKYFPRPIDGQAWYLYGRALQSPNDSLPAIEISIEDDRAYFKSIEIEEETSTLRCQCQGKLLSQSIIRLYTNTAQGEDKQAAKEIVFHLQDQPKIFSLALTYANTLLDRRDISLEYPTQYGIPKDVKIIARSNDLQITSEHESSDTDIVKTAGELTNTSTQPNTIQSDATEITLLNESPLEDQLLPLLGYIYRKPLEPRDDEIQAGILLWTQHLTQRQESGAKLEVALMNALSRLGIPSFFAGSAASGGPETPVFDLVALGFFSNQPPTAVLISCKSKNQPNLGEIGKLSDDAVRVGSLLPDWLVFGTLAVPEEPTAQDFNYRQDIRIWKKSHLQAILHAHERKHIDMLIWTPPWHWNSDIEGIWSSTYKANQKDKTK